MVNEYIEVEEKAPRRCAICGKLLDASGKCPQCRKIPNVVQCDPSDIIDNKFGE